MIPPAFRARRALEALNVAGVGLSLAAATAAVFTLMLNSAPGIAFATGLPTLIFGCLWAKLLRWPKTIGPRWLRVGWLLSIPLASLNAALACGLLFIPNSNRGDSVIQFIAGCAIGASVGVVFWGPALLLTLLCFGAPIARSQRLAERGLAGQERGEAIVGVASALVALAALLLVTLGGQFVHSQPSPSSLWFTSVLSVLGVALGGSAVALSWLRGRQRRDFVARVEAGQVEHFRVDPTDEGKVLVRVVSQNTNYRVADYEEEIAALDREGLVTRAAHAEK